VHKFLDGQNQACREDVVKLLGGGFSLNNPEGQVPDDHIADLRSLCAYVSRVAVANHAAAMWTPRDTWRHIEKVLKSVPDDSYSDKELLAAKIFLGFRAIPAWDQTVPLSNPELKLSELRYKRMKKSTTAEFAKSITLRRAFAAPMFSEGGTWPTIFNSERPTIWMIADRLILALVEAVVEAVRAKGPAEERSDVTPHLASTCDDPMGLPRLLAPNGQTYLRWKQVVEIFDLNRNCQELWKHRQFMNLDPQEAELALLKHARLSPPPVGLLFHNPRIRVLMERFDAVAHWDSGYGPLPLLEAVQSRIEAMLSAESESVGRAVSLAQAVFLGRLILDPRQKSNQRSRVSRSMPTSERFHDLTRAWRDKDIVRNYNNWLVDIAVDLKPGEINWSSDYFGKSMGWRTRGQVGHFTLREVTEELIRFGRASGFKYEGPFWTDEYPVIETIMYRAGYDVTTKRSFLIFFTTVVAHEYKYLDWLHFYFSIGGEEEPSEVPAVRMLRYLLKRTDAEDTLRASVDWATLLTRRRTKFPPDAVDSAASFLVWARHRREADDASRRRLLDYWQHWMKEAPFVPPTREMLRQIKRAGFMVTTRHG